MSGVQAIRHLIAKRLDLWEADQHQVLVEDTDHMCYQYLSVSHHYKLEYQQVTEIKHPVAPWKTTD